MNGDGIAGFGEQVPPHTLERDELQARLDLANVARADVLVSIHVDAITDANGDPIPVARTETFYTDETRWGPSATRQLAEAVQGGVVNAMDGLGYERQDRGINAHNFYMVAPPLLKETAERPNRWAQPTRGALMPSVLCEVASDSLAAEDKLITSPDGQARIADGLLAGLSSYFAQRAMAARIDVALPGAALPPPARRRRRAAILGTDVAGTHRAACHPDEYGARLVGQEPPNPGGVGAVERSIPPCPTVDARPRRAVSTDAGSGRIGRAERTADHSPGRPPGGLDHPRRWQRNDLRGFRLASVAAGQRSTIVLPHSAERLPLLVDPPRRALVECHGATSARAVLPDPRDGGRAPNPVPSCGALTIA